MKLIINLLAFYSLNCLAGYIQLEFTKESYQYHPQIKAYLMMKYNIPKTLIKTKLIQNCEDRKIKNMVQMCFENKKGSKFYSDPIIIKSLLVFGELK